MTGIQANGMLARATAALDQAAFVVADRTPDAVRARDAAIARDVTEATKLSRAERDTHLAELMAMPAADLSDAQVMRLTSLLGLKADTGLPYYPFQGSSLESRAMDVLRGSLPKADLQVFFDRRVAQQIPADERSTQLGALLRKHSSELSKDEWVRLANLLDMDPDVVRGLRVPGFGNFNSAAERVTSSDPRSPHAGYTPGVQRYFDLFTQRTAPEYIDRIVGLSERMQDRTASTDEVDYLLDEWHSLGDLNALRTPEDARAIAKAMLRAADDDEYELSFLPALQATSNALKTDAHPAGAALRAETSDLIERNVARIEREGQDWMEGYDGYPDYRELGQIRANLDHLDVLATSS